MTDSSPSPGQIETAGLSQFFLALIGLLNRIAGSGRRIARAMEREPPKNPAPCMMHKARIVFYVASTCPRPTKRIGRVALVSIVTNLLACLTDALVVVGRTAQTEAATK